MLKNCEKRKIPDPSLTVGEVAKIRILVMQRLKLRAFFTIINCGRDFVRSHDSQRNYLAKTTTSCIEQKRRYSHIWST